MLNTCQSAGQEVNGGLEQRSVSVHLYFCSAMKVRHCFVCLCILYMFCILLQCHEGQPLFCLPVYSVCILLQCHEGQPLLLSECLYI